MEYWEFLLQKEGDRSWLPIKSTKIELEAGRYRVVAHSNRTNTDVEICVTHKSTNEVPPKRRYQKRSRRTNPEGLMVVIPFTYLKPGLWELRCCGDIMSDFLGNSWQEAVQLQVLPHVIQGLISPSEETAQAEVRETSPIPAHPELVLEATATEAQTTPLTPLVASLTPQSNGNDPFLLSSDSDGWVEANLTETEAIPQTPQTPPVEVPEPEIWLQNPRNLPEPLPNPESPLLNPILEQSLQMLEQVLQQVLDPVIQEFEQPESEEPQLQVTPESQEPLGRETPWQGLLLTLDEEALVARRGEVLTLAGQVDILDVTQLQGSDLTTTECNLFQGILHYEFRHPQTSEVLLNEQKPLSEQVLPLTFSHRLEIPKDCKTCLLLGKVTLYGSTSAALASQPFTVTVDLDELLGAIHQGGEGILGENNLATALEPDSKQPVSTAPSFDESLLKLIDTPESRQPWRWESSSGQSLPPQLYQPGSTQKGSKSLELPQFPKVGSESVILLNEEDALEEQLAEPIERSLPVALAPEATDSAPTTREHGDRETGGTDITTEVVSEESSDPPPESEVLETVQGDAAVSIADSTLDTPDVSEMQDLWQSTANSDVDSPPSTEVSEASESTGELAKRSLLEPVVGEPTHLTRAFQALNSENRFWGRLNALVADEELLKWLQSELPFYDSEELTPPEEETSPVTEAEITPPLNTNETLTDFDESMWDEETDEFGHVQANIPQLQPPIELAREGMTPDDWIAQEIVVDDEQLPETESPQGGEEASSMGNRGTKAFSPQLDKRKPSWLELRSPLPTPELFIPTNELVAGEPVLVRLKLASHPARLGVKLWVQDRQSRSLLDGPRWLVDLIPNGSGELEALTQLVIPFGSVEIRFEAIAVELDSNRESHKAVLDRVVIPPDFPSLSFDEFEA